MSPSGSILFILFFFFFNDSAPTEIFTLSLHDALPISGQHDLRGLGLGPRLPAQPVLAVRRSEEHTSELQSPCSLVCRLLLEKKKRVCSTFSTKTPPTSSAMRKPSRPNTAPKPWASTPRRTTFSFKRRVFVRHLHSFPTRRSSD